MTNQLSTFAEFAEQKNRVFEALKQTIGRHWIDRNGNCYLIIGVTDSDAKFTIKYLFLEDNSVDIVNIDHVFYRIHEDITAENMLNMFLTLSPLEEEEECTTK